MTTPFAARDAKLSRSLEKAFGEQFTFSATKVDAGGDVNLPKVADGTKPDFVCLGLWENLSISEFTKARGSNPDDEAVSRSASYASVLVAAELLPWMPTRGTLCARAFDGSLYEVVKPLPDDRGRVLFVLSNKRKPI